MRRLLIAACVVAALLASIAQAGAYFTQQASVPDNVITCGDVEVSVEPTSSAVTVPVLAPGGMATRTLHVTNTGSLASNVVMTCAKKAGYTALYEALTCTVKRGSTTLYEGPLSSLRTDALEIGAGAGADLMMSVGLPDTVDDGLAGDYVRFTIYVDAEQVHS